MPVMHFELRWPDGSQMRCYSPSLVVKDYLTPGQSYPLGDFMGRARESLQIASDRVAAKFGYACSRAMDQLAEIETEAGRFEGQQEARVEVLRFEE